MTLAPVDTSGHRPPDGGLKPEASDRARLKQACADMEGLFLSHLLKTMRQTIPESGLLPQAAGHDIYQSMFDQEVAVSMSRSPGGLGLGRMIYAQMTGERLGVAAAAGHQVRALNDAPEQTRDLAPAPRKMKLLPGRNPEGLPLKNQARAKDATHPARPDHPSILGGEHDAP